MNNWFEEVFEKDPKYTDQSFFNSHLEVDRRAQSMILYRDLYEVSSQNMERVFTCEVCGEVIHANCDVVYSSFSQLWEARLLNPGKCKLCNGE